MASTSVNSLTPQERARALREMGFDASETLLLAATRSDDVDVDLSQLQRMLDAGCEHRLAVRIVV